MSEKDIKDIKSNRRLILANNRRLPLDYQEVSYLENGGAYINTGIYLDTPTDFTIKFLRYSTNTSYERIYGLPENAPNQMYQTEHYSGTSNRFNLSNNSSNVQVDIESNIIYEISKRSLTYTLVNTITKETTFNYTFTNSEPIQSNYTIYILAGYNYCSTTLKGKLYSAEFYQNNSKIRNLVPCYRITDNKPGMFDLVNSIFYTNQGTGEFICGPEVYN